MKKQILFPAVAVLGGAAAFVLRLLQNRTGFEEETGLAVTGNVPAMALIALLAVLAVLFLLLGRMLPQKKTDSFPAAFPAPEATLLMLPVMGAFLLGLSGAADLAAGLGIFGDLLFAQRAHLLLGVFTIVSAAGLFLAAAGIRKDEEFNGTLLLPVTVMLVVRLVLAYRVSSTDPTLAAYYVELLALIFLTLGFFRLSSFAFADEKEHAFTFYAAMAVVTCFASLAQWRYQTVCISSMVLYAGGAVTLLGFLFLHLRGAEEPL